MVMTWKEELLMLWILCTVLMTLAARHFLAGAIHLVEQMAAFSIAYVPGLLHLLARRLS
jgi:hypothetical protein